MQQIHNPTKTASSDKKNLSTMNIETSEFLENKVGKLVRKIQLYLQSPTANMIMLLSKSQSELLKIDFYKFCLVKTLKIIDSDPERFTETLMQYCPDYYLPEYYLCENNKGLDRDMEYERGIDYLDFEKGFYYTLMIERVGPLYTHINIKKHTKIQLLDIAINLGCPVYKSWNKPRIMQAIYPNLKFC